MSVALCLQKLATCNTIKQVLLMRIWGEMLTSIRGAVLFLNALPLDHEEYELQDLSGCSLCIGCWEAHNQVWVSSL